MKTKNHSMARCSIRPLLQVCCLTVVLLLLVDEHSILRAAEPTPTQDATLAFVRQKLSEFKPRPTFYNGVFTEHQRTDLGGQLADNGRPARLFATYNTYDYVETVPRQDRGLRQQTTTIELKSTAKADFVKLEGTNDAWYIRYICQPNAHCATVQAVSGPGYGKPMSSEPVDRPLKGVLFVVSTEDAAIRIVKALNHLIELGGGGKEIKELF